MPRCRCLPSGSVLPAVLFGGQPGQAPAGYGGDVPFRKVLGDAPGLRRQSRGRRLDVELKEVVWCVLTIKSSFLGLWSDFGVLVCPFRKT